MALVLAGLVFSIVFLLFVAFPNRLEALVRQAVKTKDLQPLRDELAAKPKDVRPNWFNRAAKSLWLGYERDMAAELVLWFAEANPEVPIGQYWIQQVLTVEPLIAQAKFSEEFLQTYFNPEVAAHCGPAG